MLNQLLFQIDAGSLPASMQTTHQSLCRYAHLCLLLHFRPSSLTDICMPQILKGGFIVAAGKRWCALPALHRLLLFLIFSSLLLHRSSCTPSHCADLVRALEPCPENMVIEFVTAASYGAGTETSGAPSFTLLLPTAPLLCPITTFLPSGTVKVSFDQDAIVGRHCILVRIGI